MPPPAFDPAWLDLCGALLALAGLAVGSLRGGLWQALRLLGLCAAVALSRALSPAFATALVEGLQMGSAPASALAWALVGLGSLLPVALATRWLAAAPEAPALSALQRLTGALLGLATGLLLHAALLICLLLAPLGLGNAAFAARPSGRLLVALTLELPLLLRPDAARQAWQLDAR